jgi:thioredoxin-like negative regulator of GroEL
MLLRAGLDRAPDHREGRLLLAELLHAAKRADAADEVLTAGLAYHREDSRYLAAVFQFLLSQQKDDRVVELARDLLISGSLREDIVGLAALAGATASFHRGRYDQAEELLRSAPDRVASPERELLATKIDWERGHRDLALINLRRLADTRPTDAAVQQELADRLRQNGATDEARRHVLAFQLAAPQQPGPRIALLHAYQDAGDRSRVELEIGALLRDFASDPAALVQLGDFAAKRGVPELAAQLLEHTRTRGLAWEPHALLHVESLLTAKAYAQALDTLRAIRRDRPELALRHESLLESLQAVALLGSGDLPAARLAITHALSQANTRAEHLLAVANRFVDLGAGEDACRILVQASNRDPLNQAVLARLIELQLELNRVDELPVSLLRFVRLRKPSPDILRVARHKLGSDLFLFSQTRGEALDAIERTLVTSEPLTLRVR